jgi:hypothetical protein
MKWPFLLPRKLRWQLSLSYITVVLVTIPTLLAVGLAAVILTSSPSTVGLSPSEQLVQFLETDEVVQVTAKQMKQQVPLQQAFSLQDFLGGLKLGAEQIRGIAIVNYDGNPLAFYGVKGNSLTKTAQALLVDQQAQNIIRAAFANDQRLADLTYTYADGRVIVAVPLLASPDHPLGVFFMAVSGLKNDQSAPSNPVIVFLHRSSNKTISQH